MNEIPTELKTSLVQLLLSVADDKLMLGHRASDWTGLAPILEEDIAFSAISQEEIAHAAATYEFIGSLTGKSADAVAYGREPSEYRCASLVVTGDEFDWARAIVRQFFCDHFDALRLERLARSSHKRLAALASRLHAEETTHVEHADTWMVHLGRGGAESKQRMQAAMDLLTPQAGMLFEPTDGVEKLEEAGIYPQADRTLFEQFKSDLDRVIAEAGLTMTLKASSPDVKGGRRGVHIDEFTALLDEMCEVYRVEPEAAW